MEATAVGSTAAYVTIIVGILTVGGVGVGTGRWYMKRREGPASDRVLLHSISEVLTGEDPTKLNPTPGPGLVAEVMDLRHGHVELRECMQNLQEQVEHIMYVLTPNGGNTSNAGDILQRLERQQQEILDRLTVGEERTTDLEEAGDEKH